MVHLPNQCIKNEDLHMVIQTGNRFVFWYFVSLKKIKKDWYVWSYFRKRKEVVVQAANPDSNKNLCRFNYIETGSSKSAFEKQQLAACISPNHHSKNHIFFTKPGNYNNKWRISKFWRKIIYSIPFPSSDPKHRSFISVAINLTHSNL